MSGKSVKQRSWKGTIGGKKEMGKRNKEQEGAGKQEVFLTLVPSNVVSVCENEEQIQRE